MDDDFSQYKVRQPAKDDFSQYKVTSDSQKKSPDQTTITPSQQSQNSGTNSNGAASPFTGNGYEWNNSNQQATNLATGTEGNPPKSIFTPETDAKLGDKKPTVYVGEKAHELAVAQGDIEEHKTNLQNFQFSDNFDEYTKLNTQLQNTKPDDPAYAGLKKQVEDLRSKPFDVRPASWDEASESQDELRKKRLPPDMQNIKTVGEAADFHEQTIEKATDLSNKIQGTLKDIQDVVNPLQAQAGIKLNKDGYHELGLYGSFMSGLMGNIDNMAKAASLIGASPEQKQAIYKEALGQEVIDPAKPKNDAYVGVQTAGGLLPYFLPGLGLEAAGMKGLTATVGNAFINSAMMGLSGGYENGLAAYKATLAQSNDENAALESANKAFVTGGITGAAVGGVGLPLAGKLGEHVALGALSKEAVESAMTDGGLKLSNLSAGEYAAYALPKQAIQALPFPIAKVIDNKFAQARGENVGTMDNVGSSYFGALLIGHAIDGLMYGGPKLTDAVKNGYQDLIARYGNDGLQTQLIQQVTDGKLTQEQADAIGKPIQAKADAHAVMPENLTLEQQKQAEPIIQKIQANNATIGTKAALDVDKETAVSDNERLTRQLHEIYGTPLSFDEHQTLGELQARMKEKDEEGKLKNPLSPPEKDLMEHLDFRQNFKPKSGNEIEDIPDVKSTLDYARNILSNPSEYKDWQVEQAKETIADPEGFYRGLAKYHENNIERIKREGHIEGTTSLTEHENIAKENNDIANEIKRRIDLQKSQSNDTGLNKVDNGAPDGTKVSQEKTGQGAGDNKGTDDVNKTTPTKVGNISIGGHGEDKHTAQGLENGTEKTDKLTDTGKQEAVKQGEDVAKNQPDVKTIFHSTVDRTRETAAIVAKKASEVTGHEVKTAEQPLLDTWDIGKAEGTTPEGTFPEKEWADKPDEKPEGGESWNSFGDRNFEGWIWGRFHPDADHVIASSKVERLFAATNEASELLGITKDSSEADIRAKANEIKAKAKEIYFEKLENEKPELENKSEPTEQLPPDSTTAGISNRVMQDVAERLGINTPESGKGISAENARAYGKELLDAGADPQKIVDNFNADPLKKTSFTENAILDAENTRLIREADALADKNPNSTEAKEAAQKVEDWQNAIQPFKTEWHKQGQTMQGEVDVNTGSFTALSRAYKEEHGEAPNEKQAAEAKGLADKVNSLTAEIEGLKQKLTEAIDKGVKESKDATKTYTERAKKAADSFRKLKTKPFTFKDSNGNEVAVHTMGPTWNDAVELGAKAIELTGKIADGVKAAVDHIKDNDWYKNLSQPDKDRFAKELAAHYSTEKPETDIHTQFANKKDSKFTPDEVKDIWDYAKENYLDKGKDFSKTIAGVSMDLGLTPEQVRDAISMPKGAKKITDEMYRKLGDRRKAVQNAQEWVKYGNQANDSAIRKGIRALSHIPDLLFAAKVFGHGTVAPITHAGMDLFQPTGWKNYFKFFLEGFKNAYGSRAEYEKRMQDLMNDPMYDFAKRNGLAIDPSKRYDDYQTFNKYLDKAGPVGHGLKTLIDIGDRGFNALKTYRLAKFKSLYDGLSEVEKADPNTAGELAKIVNHSTGTSEFGFKSEGLNKAVSAAVFAPKLEYSRWQRLIVEPTKALGTITNWENSSPSEQAAAKIVTKRSGEMIATYAAALAANAGVLALTGSKNNVNFTDPTKSDFLKFKIAGKEVNPTGGILSSIKFVGNLLGEAFTKDKDRKDKYYDMVGNYLKGKLSPFAGTVFDFATHKDYDKNILPPFDDELTWNKNTRSFSNHKMSWSEYAGKNLAPIPVAEAIKNVEQAMENKGMKKSDVTTVLNGIFVGTLSGLTGLNIKEGQKEKTDTEQRLDDRKEKVKEAEQKTNEAIYRQRLKTTQ